MNGRAKALLAAVCFGLSLVASALLMRIKAVPAAGAGVEAAPAHQARRYQRIVAMSPAVVEIVFAVGAGGRVVGISEHTKAPPEALSLPVCGGFFNPNYERLLSLRPDLIIAQGEAANLAQFARTHGIELATLELTDLASILREMQRVGKLLQVEAQAELACAELRYRLARVRAGVSDRPPVRALLVTGREPGSLNAIATVGPGTFLYDLVEVAGGRNVFPDLQQAYGVVSKEAILERAPEVVVELHGEGRDEVQQQAEARKLWSALPTLPAVQAGHVYAIEATYAMIPGPRAAELAERLAELFHGYRP